jgi:DNA-binding GntR family transcriptional regulator
VIESPSGERLGGRRRLLANVVRDALRHSVMAAEYPPDSRLPNEDELAARFAVSRATVREAVRGLVEEGYLVRRQGSGTYVTRRPLLTNTLDRNFSYTSYLESRGVRAGKRLLEAGVVAADGEIADHLRIDVGAQVVQLRRTRTADDRPVMYSVDRIPAEIAPLDVDRDREAFGGSLYELLASLGHLVGHAEAVLLPVTASGEVASALRVAEGTLLHYLEQVDVDEAGRRVMYSQEWHDPKVIELRVYRRGPGLPGS